MSEETKPAEPITGQPDPAQDTTDWKAEARKWEARAKEHSAAADKLAAREDADKTELQKALDRATAAEAKAAGFETRDQITAWKTEVATATGVPIGALRGSTLEELQEHGESLKSLIPAAEAEAPKKGALGPYVPPEGKSPTGSIGSTTGDAFAAAVESILT